MLSKIIRTTVLFALLPILGCSYSIIGHAASRIILGHDAGENLVLDNRAFAKSNTEYIVRGNCFLNGAKLKVGSNCLIVLDGGNLRGGEIVGNETMIKVIKHNRPFSNVSFSGTFIMPVIKTDFFEVDESTLHEVFNLTSGAIKNTVYINDCLSTSIPGEWLGAVVIKSHTDIVLNATISQNACPFRGGNIFYIRDCHDVSIRGSGHIVGDLLTHEGNDGESIYGIFIRNAENIRVQEVTCEYFWGDGIYIYPGSADEREKPICRNIVIDGVTCNSNRRQGISVAGGNSIIIKNSSFINTGIIRGTAPSSGIDIEPAEGCFVNDILIDNCEFNNNGNATKYPADVQVINNYGIVKISRCRINSFFYGKSDNIDLENCIIDEKIYTSSNGIGKNVRVINSKVRTINKNLIKQGNVTLINSTVEE